MRRVREKRNGEMKQKRRKERKGKSELGEKERRAGRGEGEGEGEGGGGDYYGVFPFTPTDVGRGIFREGIIPFYGRGVVLNTVEIRRV